MSIASALGLGGRKVRYAIVGLGDIAQEALMPGVKHTGNSEITALSNTKLLQLGVEILDACWTRAHIQQWQITSCQSE